MSYKETTYYRTQKSFTNFLIVWIALIIWYWPSRTGGFYEDFSGLLISFSRDDLSTFLMRDGEGYIAKSLYQFTQACYAFLILLFGKNVYAWFFLFTGLHSLVLNVLVLTTRHILSVWQTPLSVKAGLAIVFLGIVGFVTIETVVWKACLHYYIGMLSLLSILSFTSRYLITQQRTWLGLTYLVYTVSLFSIEYFYVTPICVTLLIVCAYGTKQINRSLFTATIRKIVLPLGILLGLYFILFYTLYGTFIAHQNAPISLTQTFSIDNISYKWSKYCMRLFTFDYFIAYNQRQWFSHLFTFKWYPYAFAFSAAVIGFIILYNFRRRHAQTQVAWLILIMALLSTALILPNWQNDLFPYYNDRHYYVSYLLAITGITLLVERWCKPWLFFSLLGLFALPNIIISYRTIQDVKVASKQFWNLLYQYPCANDATHVLLLNVPNYYNGIPVYLMTEEEKFQTFLNYYQPNCHQTIIPVLSYNQVDPSEGANYTWVDSQTLRIDLTHWGSWWWHGTIGASDYQHAFYKVDLNVEARTGGAYQLQLTDSLRKQAWALYVQKGFQWESVQYP